ncbi:MAG TPA: hypothetical protein QGH28_05640 [Chloroflexota bacterium]|nr:hypothetical protein [Chloroflexota bacterium]
MNKWARLRLPIVAVIIFFLGVGLNFVVSSYGIVIPFLLIWPILVITIFGLIIWAIGSMTLVKRVWYWLWGAPWDAAGYIASRPKSPGDSGG